MMTALAACSPAGPAARIAGWLSRHILPFGAPGLFLLALIDSGGIPIPQGVDVVLFAAVVANPGGAALYATLATTGSVLGCIFLYYIARKGGRAVLDRQGSPERVARIRGQFERYEALTLVVPTMVPLPLPTKLFIVAAGVFRVRFRRFVIAVLFGRVVRFFGIALVAQHYGIETWAFIRHNVLLAGLITACLVALFYWLSRRAL